MKDKADLAKPQQAPLRAASASARSASFRSAPHPVLELQSAAGNFAVQRLIQRKIFGEDHQIDGGNSEKIGEATQRGRQESLYSETMQPVWQLQRQVGNQAVQQLLRSGFIQAKLSISTPEDSEEREPDQVAQSIMRSPASAPCSCSQGGHISEECHQKQLQPIIQRRATAPSAPTHVPRIVSDVLSSPGHPLDPGIRSFMEPRFGREFSGVRVHTDAKAAESAAAVQARAYTVGHNIVFGGNESASDLPMLAHELAHVVQQSSSSPVLQRLAFCAVRIPGGVNKRSDDVNNVSGRM